MANLWKPWYHFRVSSIPQAWGSQPQATKLQASADLRLPRPPSCKHLQTSDFPPRLADSSTGALPRYCLADSPFSAICQSRALPSLIIVQIVKK